MTDRQIEISDFILRQIIDSNDIAVLNNIKTEGTAPLERKAILHHLKELKLLDAINDTTYVITLKGIEAYKVGVKKYLEELKEKETLETKLAKSNIEANNLNKIVADRNNRDRTINVVFFIINAMLAAITATAIILQVIQAE